MQFGTLRILLVRHGLSEDNLNAIWAGHKDSPLSATGINQAKALGASLSTLPIDAIYSSDLKRARRTAEEILAANQSVPPPPLVQAQTFREQNFGQAEGRSWHDANWMNSASGENSRSFRFPDGESLDEVNARMGVAVRRYILPRLEALRKDSQKPNHLPDAAMGPHIVVVAHGIAIAELLRVFMSLHDASDPSSPWPDPRVSYKRVRMENTGWTLVELAVPSSDPDAISDVEMQRSISGPVNKQLPPEPPKDGEKEAGQVMQDIVEGSADAEGLPPAATSAAPAKKTVFVRIAQQNNTDHLRSLTLGQTSRNVAGAIIAGGGEVANDTGSTSRTHQAYDARYMMKELEKASTPASILSTGDPATLSSRSGTVSKGTPAPPHPPSIESAPGAWSDVWHTICVRILPLYNGEDLRGTIEELNEYVSAHAHRHLTRSPARALDSLSKDLYTVCAAGTYTLSSHLSSLAANDDSRLLSRLADLWTFFFTSILPCIEACFLPLQTDPVLVSLSKRDNMASQTSAAGAAHASSSSNSTSSNGPSHGISLRGPRIEVRKIALTVFRDHLVLPIYERLFYLFGHVRDYDIGREMGANLPSKGLIQSAPSSDDTFRATSSFGMTTDDGESSFSVYPPLLQMSSILAGLLSQDESQVTVDGLLRALQVGFKSTATTSLDDQGPSHRMPGDASRLLDLASREYHPSSSSPLGPHVGVQLGTGSSSRPSNRHGWLPRSAVKHGPNASSDESAEALSSGLMARAALKGSALSREEAYLSSLRSPSIDVDDEPESEKSSDALPPPLTMEAPSTTSTGTSSSPVPSNSSTRPFHVPSSAIGLGLEEHGAE